MAKSSDLAYEIIRDKILTGIYQPEMHLGEAVIAQDTGVSRTPVREALRRLAADGYVTFVPHQGAFVTAWSDDSYSELISVRAELAGLAARGAAQNASAASIEKMAAIVARLSAAAADDHTKTVDELSRLNLQFHELIFNESGNRWLYLLLKQTSNVSIVQRAYYAYDHSEWLRGVERYLELVNALRARDSEWAAAIFKAHFLSSRNAILQYQKARRRA